MDGLIARITRAWTGRGPGERITYSERRGRPVCDSACRSSSHRDRVLTAAIRARL